MSTLLNAHIILINNNIFTFYIYTHTPTPTPSVTYFFTAIYTPIDLFFSLTKRISKNPSSFQVFHASFQISLLFFSLFLINCIINQQKHEEFILCLPLIDMLHFSCDTINVNAKWPDFSSFY